MPFPAKRVGSWMRGQFRDRIARSEHVDSCRHFSRKSRARANFKMRISKREKLHMRSPICARSMIGISHLLRRVSQVCVTIGALVQQLMVTTVKSSSRKSVDPLQTARPFLLPLVYNSGCRIGPTLSTFSISLFLSPYVIDRRNEPLFRARNRHDHPV